jgi:hypothetical protein
LTLVGSAGPATAERKQAPKNGSAGIGDPYFPKDGNGGYDVKHYNLNLRYNPRTDRLSGVATIRARATQSLARLNLDLNGLTVQAVRINGASTKWRRSGDELLIRPKKALNKGSYFRVRIRYSGIPRLLDEPALGQAGVFTTDDGALIAGQPHVADTWFPVNDHPLDKATYRFEVTVPKGVEVVANGYLDAINRHRRSTTWIWVAPDPMASYLATATIGQFDLNYRKVSGIRYWDAIDPTLFEQPEPRTDEQYLISGQADKAYQRLSRVLAVPAGGGRLSFRVTRDTEPDWDFFFVEAHTAGIDDWTTLPDLNGHTSSETRASCPEWLSTHPFLTHYQTEAPSETCDSSGSTGSWHAATGPSEGYETWTVDLSAYANTSVEISLSVATGTDFADPGVYVDDIVGPNGIGSTSFEADADPLDGWTVSGPPPGSPGNDSDWQIATEALTPSTGDNARTALNRQPEILDFLSRLFGKYPFGQAGAIVDNDPGLGFALENQTRPIYAQDWFTRPGDNTPVIVHELAHQWTGDSLALAGWQQIWLNESFATYAEWLWAEDQGEATAQEIFDSYAVSPPDDPFWELAIGDPQPTHLFDGPVYDRGAMTLHALRSKIGDEDFFDLVKEWISSQSGGHVTTAEFHALAEQVSGEDLDAFFQTWLFSPSKPPGISPGLATKSKKAAVPQRAQHKARASR